MGRPRCTPRAATADADLKIVLHAVPARPLLWRMLERVAAADLPGLRPFRRGCRRLAQERVVRSMLLLEISFAFPTRMPEARGTVWLADRLAGGLAGLGALAGRRG